MIPLEDICEKFILISIKLDPKKRKTYCQLEISNSRYGKYLVPLKNKIVKEKLWVGDEFVGTLRLEMKPDFIGDNPETIEIGTASYQLMELKKNGEIFYRI